MDNVNETENLHLIIYLRLSENVQSLSKWVFMFSIEMNAKFDILLSPLNP